MYISETKIRVRYVETDQMGFVYHGNYAQYNEVARVEALRQIGINYKSMEEQGTMLPVISMNIKYIKPAYYDEVLTIKTILKELPVYRMSFSYEIYNDKGDMINLASTEHVFMNVNGRNLSKAPEWLTDKLKDFFKE